MNELLLISVKLLILMGEQMQEVDFNRGYFTCTTPYELMTAIDVIRDGYLDPLPEDAEEVLQADVEEVQTEEYVCGFLPEAAVDLTTARYVFDQEGERLNLYLVEEDLEVPILEVRIGEALLYLTKDLPFDRHLVFDQAEEIQVWDVEEPEDSTATAANRLVEYNAKMKAIAATK